MIGALRLGALALNLAAVLLLLRVANLPLALAVVPFALFWWACGRAPPGENAPPELLTMALQVARTLQAAPPRFVRLVDGWTAGAARAGLGYGLVLGREIDARHLPAVQAHEIAHARHGDLLWEPFTDGPARLLAPLLSRCPLLLLPMFPILVLAVPLARATELRADRRAASVVPSYPMVLQEVAQRWGRNGSLLYPAPAQRLREVARDS